MKDLQNALKDQNRESAAGELGKPPVAGVDVAIPLTAPGRLSSVSDFEEIVVRANPDGSFIRMRDVARVSLEASSYSTESGLNGSNAAILGIYMLPGANAMQVATEVKEAMKEIAKDFPEGLDYLVPFDMTEYIAESIHEVYKTLFEALFLVILVVFLSLQSWRTALIPIVAVPISLVGTFGFMLIMGFSLNMLTLLGLVLAIGIVVDDAIVVVENVERIMEQRKIGARRGDAHRDERADRRADRHVAGAGCRLYSGQFPGGHHRFAVPAILGDDRRVRTHFCRRCADAEPGDVRDYPAAANRAQEYRIPQNQHLAQPRQ